VNKENASKLWKMIQEAGDYLQGQLPDHPTFSEAIKEAALSVDKRPIHS